MSRPRLAVGTYGEIWFLNAAGGRTTARAHYRDWDGVSRVVQATAASKSAAERSLKQKLRDRHFLTATTALAPLTPDSPFGALVDYWLADLQAEGRVMLKTIQLYDYSMRKLVMPAFESLTLREIGVARCDQFIKSLGTRSYNRARQARVVLRLAFGLAVRHEIIPRNPMDSIARLNQPAHLPDALTPQEVNQVRAAIHKWESTHPKSGPHPDGQLGKIIEVMLGTSARIGEVLALRRSDIDVTGEVPWVQIAGTIVSLKGHPTFRQDHPKTAKSNRIVALPQFTVTAVQDRLEQIENPSPDALLFSSREETPLTTNNVRRQLRLALNRSGITGITPHMFRRTVATTVFHAAGLDLAADLLGHSDSKVTVHHYIRPNVRVNPATAHLLERAFGQR